MKYRNGDNIKIGDHVLIENKKTVGLVDDIIDTKEKMEYWGVDEKGVMIKSKPFGLVFWPINDINDPVIPIEKNTGA